MLTSHPREMPFDEQIGTLNSDESLRHALFVQPEAFGNRYTHIADCELRRILFRSLAKDDEEYLRYLFPSGPPPDRSEPWKIKEAQGAVDGAEYTAAAKGTACGHIFKSGESMYHCKTCEADDSCVLCARCFESSDHEEHTVFISVSPGNSSCCDCGDHEAWRRDVSCTIHTEDAAQSGKHSGKEKEMPSLPSAASHLPVDLVEAIRMTVGRCMDYLCDVFSCSPEQLRLPKSEASIRKDERLSRLSKWYDRVEEGEATEFCLVLWNDEKHTVDDVQNQVARACSQTKKFGYEKAMEVNDIGRSIIQYGVDLAELLRMAEIIEQLKVTVTIRSARDTFREQMCATIIDWLSDISGASVAEEPYLLRNVVCEELLKGWRLGSEGPNKAIGQAGIDDHEYEENIKQRRRFRSFFQPFPTNVIRVEVQEEENDDNATNDNDDEDDDEYDEDEDNDGEEMDFEIDDIHAAAQAAMAQNEVADMEIDFIDENEDVTETLEAAIAGYPPPPPPPPPNRRRILTPAESEDGDATPDTVRPPSTPFGDVPKTPKVRASRRPLRPGKHWLEKPESFRAPRHGEPAEDLRQQVRLDYLILYDLRLWKTLRVELRHLYITTVVTLPHFKRVLGLRFAGLYTHLSQLYLIADREPDHSIILLSVQMLTTPTITQEVVDRGNFLTNLMAILYTFLTTRQVGFPEDVSPKATLAFDAGAVTNRRMFHFFLDLRWLFQSEFIHYRVRVEPRYLLQFLDLAKLHQGICPNVRALGQHVEYESDAWISASLITKETNRLCKQVAISFEPKGGADDWNLQRAIRTVAQVTMINSFGYERQRFTAAELKDDLGFHMVGPFYAGGQTYSVPRYTVQSDPMSFHHPLHYLLSWLLENGSAVLNRSDALALLTFGYEDLKDPFNERSRSSVKPPEDLTSHELLSAIFDIPVRICAWLAQMKAGMWVRNGITLRHQAHTYRSVGHRDVGYQRDLLMVQAGLILDGDGDIPGESFLAQMIDRFQIGSWVKGDYTIVPGFEEAQLLDCIEDFFHLLVIVLSERRNLVSRADGQERLDKVLQHDIAHALCFKPLSFSDLSLKVAEKVSDSDGFGRVLESMTNYRPPEGLSDTGTFELKAEFVELVDPYYAHYSRNHREEAEGVYKKHIASKTGKKAEDVVYEPTLERIESGLFKDLAAFTRTPLFAQTVFSALRYALVPNPESKLQATRIETFLHMVLHLTIIAVNEDNGGNGFVKLAADGHGAVPALGSHSSIVSLLVALSGKDEYASCHPTIKHVLKKMQLSQPDKMHSAMGPLAGLFDRRDTSSPASLSAEDKERKKQEALARQAKVMAQMKQQQNSFLQNQGLAGFDDDFEDVDDDMSITADAETVEHRKTWNFPTGTCILCQEETDDQRLFGTFAFLGESKILRSTPMTPSTDSVCGGSNEYLQEAIETPRSLDRPADDIRPFGVAGDNKLIVQKQGPNGPVNRETRGLSKGFPVQEWSKKGPVSTSCGHIMHYSCFELYVAATQRRHAQQIARNHPENLQHKEFVCPLCKALGNAFLPIIWKHKECAQEHEMHAARPIADWLVDDIRQYAPDLSFLGSVTAAEVHHRNNESLFTERAHQYVKGMFAPSLVPGMEDLSIAVSPQQVPSSPRYQLRRGLSLSSVSNLFRRSSGSQSAVDRPAVLASSPTEQQSRMAELLRAYDRIEHAIQSNQLNCKPEPAVQPFHTTAFTPLSRTLGYSVSALEIAHRGSGHDPLATSLLPDIPEQAITHLRILSETIESHLAVKMLQPSLAPTPEITTKREGMAATLIGSESELAEVKLRDMTGAYLFEDDTFLFFADWLSLMAPNIADAISVLQICYWAEIVKTIHVCRPVVKEQQFQLKWQYDTMASEAFKNTVNELKSGDTSDLYARIPVDGPTSASLFKLAQTYGTAFLRKCILLMYLRYGLDFECPYDINPEAPELERLTSLLHIPSLDGLCEIYLAQSAAGARLRAMSRRWIQQANMVTVHNPSKANIISVPHPSIFELVGLPKTYDTLTEEAIKRKCPTTGKEITDPAICLFCGAIFCSQAICCMKNRSQGGCYQHMQKCGGKIGIFITIRKCMVLFMHGPGNGSYAHAPYLDKHGEPDPTLRRHQQLFLNQRRYDKLLREAWLGHMVPTVISRKLESDNNPGGWETL